MAKSFRQFSEELDEAVQLDELKKSTYGSYRDKAIKDARRHNLSKELTSLRGQKKDSEEHGRILDKRKRGIGRSMRLAKEEVDAVVDALAEHLDLDEEQLQELSNKTMHNYALRAASDIQHISDKVNSGRGSMKDIDKAGKRRAGIKRAMKKMSEEVDAVVDALAEHLDLDEEQLQELKNSTYANYAQKALGSYTIHMGGAARANAAMSTSDESKRKAEGDKWKYHIQKATQRNKGIRRAIKSLAKEDVDLVLGALAEHLDLDEEQLQEISARTLHSYIKKSKKDRSKYPDRNYGSYMHTKDKRALHRSGARARLRGELPLGVASLRGSHKNVKYRAEEVDPILEALLEDVDLDSLTEEQLNELSQKTYASYIKKASNDAAQRSKEFSRKSIEGMKRRGNLPNSISSYSVQDKMKDLAKIVKRVDGIKRARKLRREEVDPILEALLEDVDLDSLTEEQLQEIAVVKRLINRVRNRRAQRRQPPIKFRASKLQTPTGYDMRTGEHYRVQKQYTTRDKKGRISTTRTIK